MKVLPGARPSAERARPRERAAIALAVLALCLAPYLLVEDLAFKSDDAVLAAWAAEHDLAGGLVTVFTRPFLETRFVQFYRPLYAYSFVVDVTLFGDDPRPYFLINLFWHALALGAGFLVAERLVGTRWAAAAALWFGLSPWCVNNLQWLVGRCTTVVTASVLLTVLFHLAWVRRGRRGLPLAAFACATVGVFWRESALFAPVLVALVDLLEGRRDRRALLAWAFLGLPFLVYLGCRIAVLDTFGGTYARFEQFVAPLDLGPGEALLRAGRTVLRILVPTDGGFGGDLAPSRLPALAAAAALVGLGLAGGAWRRGVFHLALAFSALHAIPLLAVDIDVHGGTSQRWHTPLWSFGLLLAVCARHARFRPVAVGLFVFLLVHAGVRTFDFSADYERGARLTHALRQALAEAHEELVFVHNVTPYEGASPNYEVGLGQLGLPPFSARDGGVLPIARQAAWSLDPDLQTPIAARLTAAGVSCAALWCDPESGVVLRIPPELLARSLEPLLALPRLEPDLPPAATTGALEDLELRVPVGELARLDLHLVTPVGEILAPRLRDGAHRGRFEGATYVEEIGGLLEIARVADGGNDGRCWLWLVGYAEADRSGGPAAVSDFIELRVARTPAERPSAP